MSRSKLQIKSGISAKLSRVSNRVKHLKYLIQKKKFPLFLLSRAKGGLFKTYKLQNMLKMNRLVRFKGKSYFTLTIPKFPSKAYDNMVAKGGLNIAAAGSPAKKQIDNVMLAITQQCNYRCQHCYEAHNLAARDTVPLSRWKAIIDDLQTMGTNIITLTGGEPLLVYHELLQLVDAGNKDLSDFHVHTSGHGVTQKRAYELKRAGLTAAGIGLDDYDEHRHDRLRGYTGAFKEALRALHLFFEADIFTYVNVCLSKDLAQPDNLDKFYSFVKDLNAGFVRFLEPRPWGGYIKRDMMSLFSDDDRKVVTDFYLNSNLQKQYRKYPPVSYLAYIEAPERLGCLMGGNSHFYIDSLGNVAPCVFLPVSFGNIMEENFQILYGRMRKAIPTPLHKQCPSVYLSELLMSGKEDAIEVPVSFERIENIWNRMY